MSRLRPAQRDFGGQANSNETKSENNSCSTYFVDFNNLCI